MSGPKRLAALGSTVSDDDQQFTSQDRIKTFDIEAASKPQGRNTAGDKSKAATKADNAHDRWLKNRMEAMEANASFNDGADHHTRDGAWCSECRNHPLLSFLVLAILIAVFAMFMLTAGDLIIESLIGGDTIETNGLCPTAIPRCNNTVRQKGSQIGEQCAIPCQPLHGGRWCPSRADHTTPMNNVTDHPTAWGWCVGTPRGREDAYVLLAIMSCITAMMCCFCYGICHFLLCMK